MIEFKIVAHGSDAYKQVVELREEILRKPLGLSFSPEDLESEKDCIHVAGYSDGQLCATLMLVPKGDEMKMQRVAIREDVQQRGIGSAMLLFAEDYAKKHGYASIYCHARDAAVPFYLKNGYTVVGDSFVEVGIVHYAMRKDLRDSKGKKR